MSRKVTVLDELGIKGGGIYAIFPYERLDEHGKGCFKVGLAIRFRHRIEGYHTAFPGGVVMTSFLENPRANRTIIEAGKKTRLTDKKYYLRIEAYVFKKLVELGAKRLDSTTRLKNKNKMDGNTEWFYTSPDTIHEAMKAAHIEYGGTLHNFEMDHLEEEYAKRLRAQRNKPVFRGEILHPLHRLNFV
jgi:hypothetical protein